MIVRPRRLRRNKIIRDMAAETRLSPSMLVYPVFIREGKDIIEEIPAMPGQRRCSLFGIPEHKDERGSEAYNENGVIQQALRTGKKHFPEMCFIGDVCLCEYTSHGHCGLLKGETVDNDPTLELLAQTALSQAQAGADIVAPSDMMDGHVAAIRAKLDGAGMDDTLIFSYAVKYASAFYGPFREAAGSAPSFGDRKSYQMDPRNVREGIREALLDIEEGADMIMVKPGLPYLDVLRAVKEVSEVPVGAYCVSGEYSMIKAAAERGWLDEKRVIAESAVCLARGGADIIVSYFAPELAKMMKEGEL